MIESIGSKYINIDETEKSYSYYDFNRICSIITSASGSPIILNNPQKKIGIHRCGLKTKQINYGTFLGPIKDRLNKPIIEITLVANNENLKEDEDEEIQFISNWYKGHSYILKFFIDGKEEKVLKNYFNFNKKGKHQILLYLEDGNLNTCNYLFCGC